MARLSGGLRFLEVDVHWRSNWQQQRGTAILFALMFMALSAVLAVGLTFRQSISLRLSADIATLERMSLAANHFTAFAVAQLQGHTTNHESNVNADTLEQAWAQPMPELELAGMIVNGKIVDLNRFFDLNLFTLQRAGKPDAELEKYLSQVLGRIRASAAEPLDLAPVLASLPLHSISELRLLPEFDRDTYLAVRKLVTAIPVALLRDNVDTHRINVNTASAELLAAMFDTSKEQVEIIIEGRPYNSEQALTNVLELLKNEIQHAPTEQAKKLLIVKSHYFLVKSVVTEQDRSLTVYTLLKRHESGWMQQLWYSRGSQ